MLVLMVFFWDLKSIIKNMIRVLPSKLLKARTKEKMGLQVLNEKFYAASVLKVMGSLT